MPVAVGFAVSSGVAVGPASFVGVGDSLGVRDGDGDGVSEGAVLGSGWLGGGVGALFWSSPKAPTAAPPAMVSDPRTTTSTRASA